jgi:hypothetical protein
VHSQNHARRGEGFRKRAVDVDHRAFQNVGRGSLNGQVDRDTLGGGADLAIPTRDFRHRPPAAEHRLDDAGLPRVLERLIDVAAHLREAGKVRLDELLRRLLRDADVLCQRERCFAVEQGIVHDLRAPPQLVPIEAAIGAKYFERGLVVDIFLPSKCCRQRLVAGQMRKHSQLNLRVVR